MEKEALNEQLDRRLQEICGEVADELITSLSGYEVCVNQTKTNFDKVKQEIQNIFDEKMATNDCSGTHINIMDICLDSKIGKSTLWEWAKRMDKIDNEDKIQDFISLFKREFNSTFFHKIVKHNESVDMECLK